jgi:hypothetical protein
MASIRLMGGNSTCPWANRNLGLGLGMSTSGLLVIRPEWAPSAEWRSTFTNGNFSEFLQRHLDLRFFASLELRLSTIAKRYGEPIPGLLTRRAFDAFQRKRSVRARLRGTAIGSVVHNGDMIRAS